MTNNRLYTSKSSGDFHIIEDLPNSKVKVRFVETGCESIFDRGNAVGGMVKDVYKRTCHGVGYLGCGDYRRHSTKAGMYWIFMMDRCYDGIYKTIHPTYEQCLVDDDWHNFQNFSQWCVSQSGYGLSGYNLDKDLLVKGNKTYSEETCCLIPQEINKAIAKQTKFKNKLPIGVSTRDDLNGKFIARLSISSGGKSGQKYLGLFNTPEDAFLAYKGEKENHIKLLASNFKENISIKAYEALMNFEVNIED